MTKLFSFLILGFVWLFFIWLAFSFAIWDLNPANWNDFARFVCAWVGFGAPLWLVPLSWHN